MNPPTRSTRTTRRSLLQWPVGRPCAVRSARARGVAEVRCRAPHSSPAPSPTGADRRSAADPAPSRRTVPPTVPRTRPPAVPAPVSAGSGALGTEHHIEAIGEPRVAIADEERITMEIVVDAYTPQEQAMGWYYSLEDRQHFPFAVRCTGGGQPDPPGDRGLAVLGRAGVRAARLALPTGERLTAREVSTFLQR